MTSQFVKLLGTPLPNVSSFGSSENRGTCVLFIKKQVLNTTIVSRRPRNNFIKQVFGHFLFGANTPPSTGIHRITVHAALVLKKQLLASTVITTVPGLTADLTIKKQRLLGKVSTRSGVSTIPNLWITDYIINNTNRIEIPVPLVWPYDPVLSEAPKNNSILVEVPKNNYLTVNLKDAEFEENVASKGI